LIFLDKQH
jgi:hypothetical protein